MKLKGRTAVVTGASQGLGACIAETFVREGASVFLCARNADDLNKAVSGLRDVSRPEQTVSGRVCDVSDEIAVERLAEEALSELGHIDVLVNNAGVYGPMGLLEDIDWREWKDAISINLLGTVYTCRAFLRHFKSRRSGKIINLSGGGATNPLPRVSAYAASKAGVVRFTETLAEELRDLGVDVNAVAPGALNTRLMRQLLDAGPELVGDAFHKRMARVSDDGATPLETGANLCVYLASAESDGVTGKLLSAQWDPWTDLQEHRADLDGSDIYTLRRIVPKDRGKLWGD